MFDTFPLDSSPEPLDTSPDPEALAIQHEQHAMLRALFLRTFSVQDAVVMSALYLEDMTAQECADHFSLSEYQVDYIRRKALRVLRRCPEIRGLLSHAAT